MATITMKLVNLDEAVKFRNYRANCMRLKESAASGFMELKLGGFTDPSSHISLECVRRAIVAECDREIENYETQLLALGVEP